MTGGMLDPETSARAAEGNPFRALPPIDELLRDERFGPEATRVGRGVLRELMQEVLANWRRRIREEDLSLGEIQSRFAAGELEEELHAALRAEAGRGVVRAINASGVVLNTGLGRAPVHPEVADRMRAAAAGYCVLEVDRYSGERNQRDERLSVLCSRLLGCEAAIAVNNNAAAAFLMVKTFGEGREVVVSRGEQVEIGGSFRVPDILASAGACMVEVGTTNRTRLADYERALTDETGLLLKVHRSNFRLVGFQEEVAMSELAELGRAHGVTSGFDLGSGRIEAEGAEPLAMLAGETEVRAAVESGLDAISFSGDKLFGGPQAGVIVGRRDAIARLRANPLYRAMRLDKSMLAGLEATLELYLRGRADELPTRAMMHRTADELARAAEALAARLADVDALDVTVAVAQSEPGSGSAPGVYLDSAAVRVRHARLSPDALVNRLRASDPPVFARIQDDAVWFDPRTLLPGDEDELARVLAAL